MQAIAQMTQQMLAFQREAPMVQAHPTSRKVALPYLLFGELLHK